VHILSCLHRTLYVGVTNNLERRVLEHRKREQEGFTKRYNVTQLVYFESTHDVSNALAREKEIKKSPRTKKKIALILTTNPEWRNLAADWLKRV